jgi:ribosomal protein S18 acetylase RimI-like enzyme
MDIQLALPQDISGIARLFKSVVEKLDYYSDKAIKNELSKYTELELGQKQKDDPYSIIVAKDEAHDIVGFCFSRMDDTLVWLEWFGVSEKARQKGIARQLVSYLEGTLEAREAHKVWCDCRTSNLKSANLLSSSGYLPICTVKNHWYGQDFILWQKEPVQS